ncbi:MAG: glycosyltransferase family 39 protein, partial [Deltaproteobacteria bacterium]|nr:glycosyltransferase family 39 protein [Deltaproteobacteria bacterium]
DATRIDPQISFSNVGYSLTQKPFQLWFLNAHHFSAYAIDRNAFHFSILWKGFLYVPKTQSVRFSLISNEIHKLSIDGQLLIDSQSSGLQKDFSDLYMTKGFHPIEISYIYTPHSNMTLDFRWFLEGKEKTVGSQYLYPAQPSQISFMIDRFFYRLQVFFITLLFLLPMAFIIYFVSGVGVKSLVRKERFWLFCFVTFLLIYVFISLLKRAHGTDFLLLLDDWAHYEQHSRSILLGDWLDRTEAPFWFTPFYRYILAFSHFIFGEGILMALMMQYFLFSSSIVLVYAMTKRLFNLNTAVLVLLVYGFASVPHECARLLTTEISATFFSCFSIYFLISFLQKREIKKIIFSGLLMGVAIIIRPNLLPFVFFVVPWLLVIHKEVSFKIRIQHSAIYTLLVLLIISFVTLRNYVTSRRVVLFNINSSPTLLDSHFFDGVPPSLKFDTIESNKVYNFFNLDLSVRKVFELVKQEPLVFFKRVGIKLGYVAGIDPKKHAFGPAKFYPGHFLIFCLYLLGVIWFLYIHRYDLRREATIIGAFAFITIGTIVLVSTPWAWRWRYQLPAVPFMLIFVAFFLDQMLIRPINFKQPLFYLRYGLLMLAFNFIAGRKFVPFLCIIYSAYYFITYFDWGKARLNSPCMPS